MFRMKSKYKRSISLFQVIVFFVCCLPLQSCSTLAASKYTFDSTRSLDSRFYVGNTSSAISSYEEATKEIDKNYALWNNNLGSIYLTNGENEKALDKFLKAHYLMNDVEAFKELEASAVSLTGSEERKAYKGDPYEKAMNSLYIGLLLYEKGDLENALASIKNGILADSDSKGDLYKSDFTILYLLAARLEKKRGNKTSSQEYYDAAVNAFYYKHPINSELVRKITLKKGTRNDVAKELNKIEEKIIKRQKPRNKVGNWKHGQKEAGVIDEPFSIDYSKVKKRTMTKINSYKSSLDAKDVVIKGLETELDLNSSTIDHSHFNKFVDMEYNVLVVVEVGKGPNKIRKGTYGEKAVVLDMDNYGGITDAQLLVDGIKKDRNDSVQVNVTYQAKTRGGREMDSILAGQAQFKTDTAVAANSFLQASNEMTNQANQIRYSNPYADTAGYAAASGIFALLAVGSAISSSMSNPKADIRHWALLPGHICVFPISLKPGSHKIQVGRVYSNMTEVDYEDEFEINVEAEKDRVIFQRFL